MLWKTVLEFFLSPGNRRAFLHSLEVGDGATRLALAKRTLFAAEMLWFYVRLLSSHCLTFQCEEEYFRPPKAAVNGEHWLQNIIGIAGTLIPHPSTPFYFLLFKIYQTLHLFT